jgi:hypothetical protein
MSNDAFYSSMQRLRPPRQPRPLEHGLIVMEERLSKDFRSRSEGVERGCVSARLPFQTADPQN